MNYYEEFGIPQDAPAARIRQAYKTLARMLHPDAQSEEALKAMAECQMKRLNGMLDTLLDPEKRRAYDEALLEADYLPPPAPAPARLSSGGDGWVDALQAPLRQWFWILTGLMIVGLAVWYAGAGNSPVAEVAPARSTAASVTVPEDPPSARPAVATVSRAAATPIRPSPAPRIVAEAPPSAGDPPFLPDPLPPPAIEPSPVSPPPAPADEAVRPVNLPGAAAPATSEKPSSWAAGTWLYMPQPESVHDSSLYSASYIEFLLVEEHGILAGNYRARYRIPNKALASEVGFRAEGQAPSGNSAKLVWTSDEGGKGEVDLTLQSANLMKVTWWTTAFGRRAGLASGTATLVRQRER
jgi:hypothetical protein